LPGKLPVKRATFVKKAFKPKYQSAPIHIFCGKVQVEMMKVPIVKEQKREA